MQSTRSDKGSIPDSDTLNPKNFIEVTPKMHLEGFKDSPYCCKRVNKICKCCKCSSGEEDATRMSSTKANTNGRFRKTSSMNH
ncbi:hypothetical protein TNCV_4846021 [Trichonephila clavipes]|uniref:Uncharacterized protein n=1 Tax=Trichonephila clavipes TaxID=2585209 RepID=A0A8X6WJU2_TRICX|nr:hypothetical protein TNCV_4846021 [Trichonephila clavipes]